MESFFDNNYDKFKNTVDKNNINLIFNHCCNHNLIKDLEFLLSIENEVFSEYDTFYNYTLSFFGINNKINIHINNEDIFKFACRFTNIDVINFLLSLEKTHGKIDIHNEDEYIFKLACLRGNLDIIKLLLSLEETHGQIKIHIDDEYLFRHACFNGNLEIIKLLLSLEETHGKINIHKNNEYAFRFACHNGNMNVIIFLLSLEKTHGKINIHEIDNDAFLCDYLELRKLLINLTDDLTDYKKLCNEHKYMTHKNTTKILIQIKENKIEENKKIINMNIENCPICDISKKYFFDFDCGNKHFICINCFYKYPDLISI